ncbi:MAG: hypothetical protein AAB776_01995 [Patescibacteria group bacterium]
MYDETMSGREEEQSMNTEQPPRDNQRTKEQSNREDADKRQRDSQSAGTTDKRNR